MKLIDEIIGLLSSTDGSLTDALLKTKVLLSSLGQDELNAWVNNELNGYSEDQELPSYRIVPAQVLANLSGIGFTADAHPLPIAHLDKEQRENIETARMYQSLAVLEKFAAESDGTLATPIPLEANHILGKNLTRGTVIQRAWSQIQTSSIVQIVTEVRSRLLDFVLKIQAKLPEDPSAEEKHSIDTRSLFQNSMFGDNATVIIGDKNKTEIVNLHLKGNLDALAHELMKFNVADEDIETLKKAIKADAGKINNEKKEFGPSVKLWMKNMLHKAVEASWHIELSMAATVLSDALKHYYGWWQ